MTKIFFVFFSAFFSYAAVGALWFLHWLPLPLLRFLGRVLGALLFCFARKRCQVVRINLQLCFPNLSEAERSRLLRRHFVVFAQSLLDRSLLWWASRQRLLRLIHLKGAENLQRDDGCPTLLLAPHFVGLDVGGIAIALNTSVVSVYSNQKNPVFNAVFLAGRMRFNAPVLLSRQEGMRRALKSMKQGLPFYYLPDMDFGRKESIFVPFFGVPAATITGVSRLARITGAKVVPCIARMTAKGYDIELMPPWENFPGASVEEDTVFMNQYIARQVETMPEQYYWLHKRFKTRPPGEVKIYPS
ncbi:lipid A biosynthesis lauroyltransferase [Betaproteobacteria bacterium]|nr:lipid A biosynthesis lauroyltransferase [Betaproteobacteria bacterium]GHU10234.1 lipid A biosynthesis lauroyltransferase [Betaproteobacteria bacterium]GHU41786.1 lipid A biosynthesis lauroyltransferase [Betaproteobacteria bacterium]